MLCSIGCQNKEQTTKIEYVYTFKEETTVLAKEVEWIDNYEFMSILCIDSFLIILNNKKSKNAFQVYNTVQKNLVVEAGTFGRGPNEFEFSRLTQQYYKDKNGTFFYLWDEHKKYFYTINLEKLISGKDFIEKKVPLSDQLTIQSHVIKIDSVIIGSTMMKEGSLFKYNLLSSKLDFWPNYPNDEKYKELSNSERYNFK